MLGLVGVLLFILNIAGVLPFWLLLCIVFGGVLLVGMLPSR
jgi:hypothetical protein